MRKKEKFFMGLLIITFLATAGMFYYQNVYLEQKAEANKVTVLVAKRNIPEGSSFTADNVGAIKLDKEFVLPTYITSFDQLKGKRANSDLLQNELITTSRIEQDSDGSKMFTVSLKAEVNSNIEPGDAVRVYVQMLNGDVYELFHKKEVIKVNMKKNASGKETGVPESLDVLLSDKEVVYYFNAQKAGTILVVKYNDLTEQDQVAIPKFDSNLSKARNKTKNAASSGEEEQGEFVIYTVRSGDTWSSIAEKLGTTQKELMEQNPGIVTLSPGDKIQFKKN